jgi:hypothetical protein
MTMTDTPILSTVSPALHPASVEPFAKAGEIVTKAAQRALGSMYSGLDAMQTCEQATRQTFGVSKVVDGAEIKLAIPYAQAVILHADLGARFAGIARGFDASLDQINTQIATLEGRVAKSLVSAKRDAVSGAEFSDIRKYVAGLEPNKRMDFLHGCINFGDVDVIHACIAALGPPV